MFHRDLKTENVLMVNPEKIDRLKLADFGLASAVDGSNLTTICGSATSMAPEMILGKKYGDNYFFPLNHRYL